MKNVLKLTLAVVCVMFSTSLFAQKIGRINTQEIIINMNEFKEANTQLEAYAKDLSAQLETIMQVRLLMILRTIKNKQLR